MNWISLKGDFILLKTLVEINSIRRLWLLIYWVKDLYYSKEAERFITEKFERLIEEFGRFISLKKVEEFTSKV